MACNRHGCSSRGLTLFQLAKSCSRSARRYTRCCTISSQMAMRNDSVLQCAAAAASLLVGRQVQSSGTSLMAVSRNAGPLNSGPNPCHSHNVASRWNVSTCTAGGNWRGLYTESLSPLARQASDVHRLVSDNMFSILAMGIRDRTPLL